MWSDMLNINDEILIFCSFPLQRNVTVAELLLLPATKHGVR
jgi:hypothetical protein